MGSCIFVLDTLFTFASHGLTRGRCFGFDMLMLVPGGVGMGLFGGIRTFTLTSVLATTSLHAFLLCNSYHHHLQHHHRYQHNHH